MMVGSMVMIKHEVYKEMRKQRPYLPRENEWRLEAIHGNFDEVSLVSKNQTGCVVKESDITPL